MIIDGCIRTHLLRVYDSYIPHPPRVTSLCCNTHLQPAQCSQHTEVATNQWRTSLSYIEPQWGVSLDIWKKSMILNDLMRKMAELSGAWAKPNFNKLRWYPQQPQRLIFLKSFWSVLSVLQSLPDLLRNLVELDLALRQSLPDLLRNLLPPRLSPEPSLEPCWTWPGSEPKPPKPSPEPSPEPCWTWPGSAPKPPGTFSGTFFGTLLNLTWLSTKAS